MTASTTRPEDAASAEDAALVAAYRRDELDHDGANVMARVLAAVPPTDDHSSAPIPLDPFVQLAAHVALDFGPFSQVPTMAQEARFATLQRFYYRENQEHPTWRLSPRMIWTSVQRRQALQHVVFQWQEAHAQQAEQALLDELNAAHAQEQRQQAQKLKKKQKKKRQLQKKEQPNAMRTPETEESLPSIQAAAPEDDSIKETNDFSPKTPDKSHKDGDWNHCSSKEKDTDDEPRNDSSPNEPNKEFPQPSSDDPSKSGEVSPSSPAHPLQQRQSPTPVTTTTGVPGKKISYLAVAKTVTATAQNTRPNSTNVEAAPKLTTSPNSGGPNLPKVVSPQDPITESTRSSPTTTTTSTTTTKLEITRLQEQLQSQRKHHLELLQQGQLRAFIAETKATAALEKSRGLERQILDATYPEIQATRVEKAMVTTTSHNGATDTAAPSPSSSSQHVATTTTKQKLEHELRTQRRENLAMMQRVQMRTYLAETKAKAAEERCQQLQELLRKSSTTNDSVVPLT